MSGMKNIPKNERMTLASQIDYQPGQVVSKTLAQNNAVSLTLFSFEKGAGGHWPLYCGWRPPHLA